jgi:hypothetical protein
METELGVFSFGSVVEEEEEEDCWRTRSPRMTTSCWMTDLPARTMWGVPWRRARREILLPVSCKGEGNGQYGYRKGGFSRGARGWENVQSRCIRRERRFSAAC